MRKEHGTDEDRLRLVYGCRVVQSGTLLTIHERVYPEDRPQAEALIRQGDDKAPETVEFRYRLPGGGTLCLGARAERVSPNCLIGITFDITDRKIAEEQAWRSSNHDLNRPGIPGGSNS